MKIHTKANKQWLWLSRLSVFRLNRVEPHDWAVLMRLQWIIEHSSLTVLTTGWPPLTLSKRNTFSYFRARLSLSYAYRPYYQFHQPILIISLRTAIIKKRSKKRPWYIGSAICFQIKEELPLKFGFSVLPEVGFFLFCLVLIEFGKKIVVIVHEARQLRFMNGSYLSGSRFLLTEVIYSPQPIKLSGGNFPMRQNLNSFVQIASKRLR